MKWPSVSTEPELETSGWTESQLGIECGTSPARDRSTDTLSQLSTNIHKDFTCVRLQVLTAASTKMAVFWVVVPRAAYSSL
jgi:hypothetical protein